MFLYRAFIQVRIRGARMCVGVAAMMRHERKQSKLDAPIFPSDGWTHLDPLDADVPGDVELRISCRQLMRIALAAVETGARFQREGIGDAMTWLMTPHRDYDDRPPIEACVKRDICIDVVVYQGLGMGAQSPGSVSDRSDLPLSLGAAAAAGTDRSRRTARKGRAPARAPRTFDPTLGRGGLPAPACRRHLSEERNFE